MPSRALGDKPMESARIVAEVKVLPIYQCSICKKKTPGTRFSYLSFDEYSFEQIARRMRDKEVSPRGMPFGWSHNGEFQCNACKKGVSR